MKFYDREKEIATIETQRQQSLTEARMTVLTGRRRIGKTELALRGGGNTTLYFFVARKAEALLCADFTAEAERMLGLPVGSYTSFASLFGALMRLSAVRPFTLVIDEFQEFLRINTSVFSEIQREWDLHKSESKMHLIISGSVYSLMHKIFEDYGEPLFGRANCIMRLKPFDTTTLKAILSDHNHHYNAEDLLSLYAVTGGIAWYVALLMDNGCNTRKSILGQLTAEGSPFIAEGKSILIEEFGSDYAIYFSILSCIASGLHTRSEIEAMLHIDNIGGYLARLEKYYGLIERHTPIFSKESSKKNRYVVSDSFLTFWFRFFYKYQSYIESGGLPQLARIIERDYDVVSGFMLERYFRQKLQETGHYTRIGQYWDRKGGNEIDLIAVNEIDREAWVYEIKKDHHRYSEPLLRQKAEALLRDVPELRGMDIHYGCLSMDDM